MADSCQAERNYLYDRSRSWGSGRFSRLSAIISTSGSTRIARRAGTKAASTAVPVSTTTTAPTVYGSPAAVEHGDQPGAGGERGSGGDGDAASRAGAPSPSGPARIAGSPTAWNAASRSPSAG